MDAATQARCVARARIMKALAHHCRLFMLEELAKGERCVFELASMVGSDVSTVSKHLTVLKTAGIVSDQKRGNKVFYRLRTPCVLKVFDCINETMQELS